ncbi:MAG: outer membrane beta-barrel protein [Crocinitomicaceae bacterium]|jgi:opacity protein-like surface antigen|nr:outer membrane beta-barrel protein [Crocinitomicaceae bacterium]MDP4760231.1 outer membrane beta-barrel protein [Crocinitomicaceae bacterium]
MKKFMIFVSALTLSGTMFAQKPTSSDAHFSLEGLANLNTSDGMTWTAPSIRMRYFINDNFTARLQFGFGGDGTSNSGIPSKETHNYAATVATDANGTVVIDRGSMDVKLGAEYHLKGTDKMSPYFTANIGFGNGSEKQTWTDVFYSDPQDPSTDLAYANGFSATASGGFKSLGFGIGAGFDYYVADNLYLGLEMNLTTTKVTYNDASFDATIPGGNISSTSLGSTMSYTNIGAAHGSIRIGWRF